MLKRSLVVSAVVFLAGSICAPALDIMGPPTTGLDFGKWGAGFSYFYSEEDMDLEGAALSDVESNRYYGWVGYGVSDWWEAYVRLGLSDIDIDDLGFDDSHTFIGSLGTKVTFAQGERVDWGFLIQGTWSQYDDNFLFDLSGIDPSLGLEEFDIDIEMFELQMAVGPVIKFDGLKLYGGPFYYCNDGEVEIGFDGGETDFDLEEDSEFGGYAGVIVDLGASAALTVEGLYTGDGWGAGANIGWEF